MNSSLIPHPSSLIPHPSSLIPRPSSLLPAFSLVELLVVIGIIGILAGVLLTSFGKGTASARMAKCASNMRNLAVAIRSTDASAQSYQYAELSNDVKDPGIKYHAHKGWISYLDQGTEYPLASPGSFTQPSFAGSEEEKNHALTNGAIWKTMGGNHNSYLCPEFVRICNQKGVRNPGWSYQMNPYFGYEPKPGVAAAKGNGASFRTARADRILLLAEIQALELSSSKKTKSGVSSLPEVNLTGDAGDPTMDGCLLYKAKGGDESIGFNHYRGNEIVGHVAFADGHVEVIAAPKNGNFVDLTDWLCRGCDIVYQDGAYQEVKDSDVE